MAAGIQFVLTELEAERGIEIAPLERGVNYRRAKVAGLPLAASSFGNLSDHSSIIVSGCARNRKLDLPSVFLSPARTTAFPRPLELEFDGKRERAKRYGSRYNHKATGTDFVFVLFGAAVQGEVPEVYQPLYYVVYGGF